MICQCRAGRFPLIVAILVVSAAIFDSNPSALAVSVTLNGNNAGGSSGFNAATNWDNGLPPAAGNDYFTSAFLLRTPTSIASLTFAGDSLTIDAGGRLIGKNGTAATTQTLNFTNGAGLILNGGTLDIANASSDSNVMVVTGKVNVIADSLLGAFGTNGTNNNPVFETMDITAPITGSAGLSVAGPVNGGTDAGVVRLSAANPYSGTITVIPATGGINAIASQFNRLMQLNNLNAVQNATVMTVLTNAQPNLVSFASAANTGTFNIGALGGAANQQLADTAGNPVTVNVGSNNGNTTYSGALTGAGSLIKSGNGTMILSGANTYTGTTTINSGKVVVTSALPSAVTLNNGTFDGTGVVGGLSVADATTAHVANGNGTFGALTVSSLTFNGDATVDARVSPLVPIAINATGALTTTPANGQVVVNAAGDFLNGPIKLIGYGTFGGALGNFTLGSVTGLNARQSLGGLTLSGSSVALNVNGDSLRWTGSDSTEWVVGATGASKNWKLVTAGSSTDYIQRDIVRFDDTAPGASPIAVNINSADVSPVFTEFTNNTKAYVLGGFFGIAGGAVSKSGTGAVTINTTNTYAGGTNFTAGTLNIGNVSALGTGTFTIAAGSAKTLDNTSGFPVAFTSNITQNWNDNFTFAGSADTLHDLDMGTGTVTLGGSGTDRTVTVNGVSTLTVGELKSTTQGLIKNGTGTLVLSSVGVDTTGSSLGGVLNVAAGTVQISRTGAAVGANGDLVTAGLIGSGTVTNGSADIRSLYVDTPNTFVFTGNLLNGGGGGLGFLKRGTGTQTLAGTNDYTSNTRVDAGTLIIKGNNTGAGTNAQINAGKLVLAHPNALGSTSVIRLAGNNTSTLSFATDGSDTLYNLVFASGVNATIESDRATPGPGINHTLTTQGSSNGLGGGVITFTSGPNVTSGTGRITIDPLNFSAGSVQTTSLNPTTANVSIGAVTKTASNFAQTLELGGTSTDNFVTGSISDGINVAQVISVLKSGTSTWTLQEASYYSGTTTVTGGTLLVNNLAGGGTGFGPVSVTGGTLGGAGTIDTSLTNTNVTIAAGGNLAPGSSGVGTLNFNLGAGSMDLSGVGAGGLKFELGAPSTGDQILVNSGTLNIGTLDFSDFTFTNAGGVAVGTYKLFDAQSDITGSIGTASGSFGGFAATLSLDPTNFDVLLNVTGLATLVGDYNNDGKVDAADYVIWRKNPAAHNGPQGYTDWRANFGKPGPGSGSLAGGSAVPEPSSLGLLALFATAILARGRKR